MFNLNLPGLAVAVFLSLLLPPPPEASPPKSDFAVIMEKLDASAKKNLAPTANQLKREAGDAAFLADVQDVAGKEYVFPLLVKKVSRAKIHVGEDDKAAARRTVFTNPETEIVCLLFDFTGRRRDPPKKHGGWADFQSITADAVSREVLAKLERGDTLWIKGKVEFAGLPQWDRQRPVPVFLSVTVIAVTDRAP